MHDRTPLPAVPDVVGSEVREREGEGLRGGVVHQHDVDVADGGLEAPDAAEGQHPAEALPVGQLPFDPVGHGQRAAEREAPAAPAHGGEPLREPRQRTGRGCAVLVVCGVERRFGGDVRGGEDAVPAMGADDVGRVDVGQPHEGREVGRQARHFGGDDGRDAAVGHVPQRRHRRLGPAEATQFVAARRLEQVAPLAGGQLVHVRGGAEQGIGAGPIAVDLGDGRQRGQGARQRVEVRAREGMEEGQPFAAPAAGGLVRRASLVSMGRLAAAHAGRPPSSTTARNPRSISDATTRAATISSGSES